MNKKKKKTASRSANPSTASRELKKIRELTDKELESTQGAGAVWVGAPALDQA